MSRELSFHQIWLITRGRQNITEDTEEEGKHNRGETGRMEDMKKDD